MFKGVTFGGQFICIFARKCWEFFAQIESKRRANARLFYLHLLMEKRKWLLRREKNRVNDVDNTVGCFDICNNDLYSIVQVDFAILYGNGDILA